jgi:hypothetical protein
MMDAFLSPDELFALTGRRIKSKQIEALRTMGLPFFVNAVGKPVVSRSVIDGGKAVGPDKKWTPRILGNAA